MSSFLTVLNQVSVLFLLMGLGYALSKFKVINDECSSSLTTLLCYIIGPCVILGAFQQKYTPKMFRNLLIMCLVSAIILGASIIIFHLIFNKKTIPNRSTRSVLRFSSVYTNCGFMGYPLVQALAGSLGLFYASVFNGVFNLFCWSHGIALFTGKISKKDTLKAIVNPNILALFIGVILFRFSLAIPEPINTTVKYLAALNTPFSMIIIGTTLTRIPLKSIFSGVYTYLGVLIRNLISPIAIMFALHFCGVDSKIALVCTVLMACPTAGLTVIFSKLTKRDVVFPGKLLTMSTLLSIVTIPFVIFLVTYLKF